MKNEFSVMKLVVYMGLGIFCASIAFSFTCMLGIFCTLDSIKDMVVNLSFMAIVGALLGGVSMVFNLQITTKYLRLSRAAVLSDTIQK